MKRLAAFATAALLIGGAAAAAQSSGRVRPVDELGYVRVESGDSFWSIARELDLSCTDAELWAANGRTALDPGAMVLIPPGCMTPPATMTTVASTTATGTTGTTAPDPGPTDRPNATTTGHDGNLTRTFGPTTIDGAWLAANNGGSLTIENVRFDGGVKVLVDDVTIRNFEITGGTYGVDSNVFEGSVSGLVLEDGEISGQSSSGLLVSGTAARRLHIHHQGADAVKAWNDVVFEDSYVHHLGSISGSHSDGVQMVGGSNVTIRRNHFDMPHDEPGFTNSQVMIIQTHGPIDGVIIDGNWINGGGYSVQITDKGVGYGYPRGVEVTNNRFGREYQYGPLRFKDGTPDVVAGNVWDDTGAPI